MSHPFRQRLSNSLSLLALLINLLPPVPLVQAHAEPLTPAEHAHQSPAPTLIASRESLTPITTRADAVLPRWFKPPVASSMDSDQTAVLSLAKPAALVELEARRQRPVISSQKAEAKNQPPAAVLPGWFAPAQNVILSEAENPFQPQQPAGLAADTAQPIENANTPSVNASVLPGWFASSANSEKGLGTASTSVPALGEPPSAPVLPNWFNTHPSQIPNPTPSAPRLAAQSLNPQLPAVSGQRPALRAEKVSNGSAVVLPGWFQSTPSPHLSAAPSPATAVSGQPSAIIPFLAPIPEMQVNVFAPSSVSAGNFLGDTYTVTIRNGSPSTTAFTFSITATIPAIGFIYADTAQLISSINGVIAITDAYTDPLVVWTPTLPYNLAPGEVVTLTFRMTTDGSAISGQRLDTNAVYQNPPGSPGSSNGGVNITVGRGNLVISKSPTIQSATFGDVLTWTIEAANTGLGTVYSATVSDIFGAGYTATDASQLAVAPFTLTVGQRRSFVVTATVNSCTNLTNTALALWSIGNDEGDGTAVNPVSDTVDILYLLEEPDVNLAANNVAFAYCTPSPQTVVVTATNTGGPARNFVLDSNLEGQPFTVGPAPGWAYNPASGVFSYTANGGALTTTVVTLSFVVTPTFNVCAGPGNNSFTFSPRYQDACGLPFTGPPVNVNFTYGAGQLPTFALTKTTNLTQPGPSVFVGVPFDFYLDFDIQNVQNISGNIVITDILPSVFTTTAITPSVGSFVRVGNAITWTITAPAGPGAFSGRLTMTVQAQDVISNCGANSQVINTAFGNAPVRCPGCPALTDISSQSVFIQNVVGTAFPRQFSTDGQVCGLLTMTNRYLMPVNSWNGVIFTETLGFNDGVPGDDLPPGSLSYVTNTLSVIIDGIDVTGQVIISQTTPQLVLDFRNVTVPTGTHAITIGYSLFISDTVLAGAPQISFFDWSIFTVPGAGGGGQCQNGNTFFQGVPIDLQRADLNITISPSSFAACATVPVTLTVSDPELVANALVARNIVVTFNVGSPDFGTISGGFTYGGGFAGNPVTVTTGGNIITWTFQNPLTQTGTTTGTIHFDMTRSCTAPPLNAGVRFTDRCNVTYGNTTSNSGATTLPDVRLFVTPDTFTVNENKATWRIYLTNIGAGAAGRVAITDALGFGLRFVTYTTNAPAQVNLLTPGPYSAGQDIIWEALNLAPGQQIYIDVTAADVVACGGLTSDITITSGCLGDGNCPTTASDSLVFILPPFAVRSENAQTADLPFCDIGEVVLTVKNSSASAHIYQMVITETITALGYVPGSARMTVTNRFGAVISGLANIPFEPITSTVGPNTILLWRLTNPGLTLSQTQILTDRAPEDSVTVRFQVQTDCTTPGQNQVQASAGGLQPCGTFFFRDEAAVTLDTLQPQISLSKEGRNLTTGSAFGATVIGQPGDTIVWRVTVNNALGAYIAPNVIVTDTLPANMNAAAPAASATAGVITPTAGLVTWNLGDLPADGANRVLLITSTIDSEATACQLTTTNLATLIYGCDNGCTTQPLQATANLQTRPSLTGQTLNTTPLNTCGGLMTVTLTNNGPPAYNVFLTDTLPAGFTYQQFVSASTLPVISPTVGVTTGVFAWTGAVTIPTGVTTLTFRVANSSTNGACATPVSGPNNLSISFDDDAVCSATGPYTSTSNSSVTVQSPNLVIDKSPLNRVADAGQIVTWTVTVTNTGLGDAIGVVITDIVGSGFTGISAGGGRITSTVINTPAVAGQIITWSPAVTIPAGSRWQAIVTATVNPAGTGVPTNTVQASGGCASGCTYAAGSDTSFVTLLTSFDKAPTVQTGTIGSLVVFTFSASLPDIDALYQNLILTDTLPTGLGYVSSVLTYTFDMDGGGTTSISTTPTLAPAAFASGNVVWQLGNLPGSALINGVITAVVQNIPSNQNGVAVTNRLSMTYVDQGQSYLFTDTAQVNIVEPILHLGKSYLTPQNCNATLLQDNFNDNNDTGWTQVGGAGWSVVNGVYQNSSDAANRRSFNGNFAWTDYSFSAMIRSTDDDEIGLIFRAQGDNTSFYRFQWRQQAGATIGQRLERVVAGAATAIASNAVPYVSRQWYHLEVRAEGSRLRVFVDSQLIFDVIDTTFAAGRIGLYANNENTAFFDDVLVTRLGQQGCFVGANDLVTYTLTVSNQGQLPGYDLVITDAIPAGMNLVTYSLQSDDPASAFTAAPVPPVPGAANLVWNINQLTNIAPFNPLAHTALTITVVLSVSDGITANTVLSNQAFLLYDNWPGNSSPTPISRTYSGGSHSTAVRTVDGGIAKVPSIFSPPPTATLGSLVTYTLIVPAPPITATLYGVVVTDQLNLPRFFIQSATTSGGTGGAASFDQATGLITATFASIPHDTQAFITITARISHEFPSPAADPPDTGPFVITNSTIMTHATAPVLTTSNVVTTTAGQPDLALDKASIPPDGSTVQAGATVTYSVSITNQPGPGASIAYDLVVTDTLPAQMRSVPPVPLISLDGAPLNTPADYTSSYSAVTGVLIITFASSFSIPVGSAVQIIYTAQVDDNLPVGTSLTNQAQTVWSSLPGDTPGDRDYPPITDTTTLTNGGVVTLTKRLNDSDATRPISDTVPYSIVLDLPLGAISNLVVTDTLDAGLIYDNNPVFSGPAGLPLPPPQTVSTPNDGTAPVTVVWDFGNVTNPAANPQPIVISFTATVANVITNVDGLTLDNDAIATWSDASGPQVTTDTNDTDDVITITVPALVVEKSVNTPQVVPGGLVTWTVIVRNVGSGTAFGVDLTDTLPSTFFTYQPGSSQLNGGPIADPTVAGLTLFWDLNQTLAGGAAFTLTFQALVNPAIPTGVFTNIASAINGTDGAGNPIPPDNSGPVPPDTDDDDTDDATVLVTLLSVTKSVDPASLAPDQVATYTILVNNPGGTAITLTVTDTLPAGFAYADNALVNSLPDEPDVIAPPTLVWSTLPVLNPGQSLTITFHITAATQVAGLYTNTVVVTGTDDSGNVITDTDDVPVILGTNPGIVVTKTRVTPSPVAQGGQVVYNLTVQNIGNTTFFTVPLVDTFNPAELQFVGASPAPDSTNPAGTLTWNDLTTTFGDFVPGAAQTVVVTFTAQFAPGGVTAVNAVQATGIDTNTTTVTDTDSTTVTILSPQLDFNKVVSPGGTINPGQRLDYLLCVTNSGTLTATNVVITDFVPFNTTFIPGSVIAPLPALVEYQDNGGAFVPMPPITTTGLRWTLAQLPPGSSTCVGFSVNVNLTISDTLSGLSVMASPLGWIVLAGDTTGLEIITRTTLTTPTVTPTPVLTPTATPTVSLSPTPEITATSTITLSPTPEISTTPEVTATLTPTPAPTPPISATATVISTDTPTPTSTPTLTATITLSPTETATPISTDTPTLTSTATLEPSPTPASATETPTTPPTPTAADTPGALPPAGTTEPSPTVEPSPTAQAVLPGWFMVAVGMVAAPALYGQPAFQEPITPANTVEPTTQPEATATIEATTPPEATATVEATPMPTVAVTPTETAQPTATLTETVVATPAIPPTVEVTPTPELAATPEVTVTLTPEVTLVPTSSATIIPEVTATAITTGPEALTGYPIVPFDTVIVNIPNVATIGSDQTPTQTDVVTNPVIRIVDPLLTKVVNPSQASPGDLVSFQLVLDNPSPPSNANATNLVLVDPLPYLVDLLSYNISSVPPGLVDSVTVVTSVVPIVGHPNGITQTVATTITAFVPVLGPNEHVVLDLTTRVNNLASPPPQTIRNIAFLTFDEGDTPPVTVAVDVPLPPAPPSDKGNDDDDGDDDGSNDNNVPLPPTAIPAAPPVSQPAPALPVNLLPETGTKEAQATEPMLGGTLLLLMGLVLGTSLIFWRARFKRRKK